MREYTDDFEPVADQHVPYSQEAEEALLGALIVDGALFPIINGITQAAEFFLLRHNYIFQALAALHLRGDAIDYLTVGDELERMGHLSEVGGNAYLTQLINQTPTSVHAETYAHLINRTAVRRKAMAAADEIKLLALDEDINAEEMLGAITDAVLKVSDDLSRHAELPFSALLSSLLDDVEYRREHGAQITGVVTPFSSLNRLLLGLQPEDVYLLGGRPSMGKTALMLDIAIGVALSGTPVGVISLEMAGLQLAMRAVAAQTGLSTQLLRSQKLSDGQFSEFVGATKTLTPIPLQLYTEPNASMAKIWSSANRMVRRHKIELLCIDYLGLISLEGLRDSNPYNHMTIVSRQIKQLARMLKIPVIAVHQLSRAVEDRPDKRPMMRDLRDSGSLEQDSDGVFMLYRDVVYNPESELPDQAELLVRKNRNGPTGKVLLHWDAEMTHFRDWRQVDG